MNTIKINAPKGHKINFNPDAGEVNFEELPKSIRERLQTVDDILAYHGQTQESFDKWCEGIEPHEKARRLHELMVAAYNEGEKPDWRDGTGKWFAYFNMPDASGAGFSFFDDDFGGTYSSVGARLVFVGAEARENLKDSVSKFLDIYEKSFTL